MVVKKVIQLKANKGKLSREDLQSVRAQEKVLQEYVKSKEQKWDIEDEDAMSDMDETEQYQLIDRLDVEAQKAGLTSELLQELLKQQSAQVEGVTSESQAASESSQQKLAEQRALELKMKADSDESTRKKALEEAEKAEEQEKKAKKELLIAEAKARAEQAKKDLAELEGEATSKEPAKISLTALEPLTADDYVVSETEDEEQPKSLSDLNTKLSRLESEQKRSTQTSRTALEMAMEQRGREMASLQVYLPRKWDPKRLQSELMAIRNSGYLQNTGFVSMALTGVPIRIQIECEPCANDVMWAIQSWNPQISMQLDTPTENARQSQQSKELLKAFITHVNSAQCEVEVSLTLQYSKKRSPKKGMIPDEQADWWSLCFWQDDTKVPILRCEYNHARMTQLYKFRREFLQQMRISRTDLKNMLHEEVSSMYVWDLTEVDVLELIERKVIKSDEKDKEEEYSPPPPKMLKDSAKAYQQKSTTYSTSAGKGGKGKGKDKGKQKGKGKGGGKQSWSNFDQAGNGWGWNSGKGGKASNSKGWNSAKDQQSFYWPSAKTQARSSDTSPFKKKRSNDGDDEE